MAGPLGFAMCPQAAGYTGALLERGSLRPGDTFRVRTNGHRLALVAVVGASEQAVEFGATVWDPTVPS